MDSGLFDNWRARRRHVRAQFEVLENRHLLAGLSTHTGSFISTPADPWIPNFVETATFALIVTDIASGTRLRAGQKVESLLRLIV